GAGKETELAAQNKANTTYARLIGGDDFATVARDISEDKPSAAHGGDVGLVREGQVNAVFFAAAAALKAGELSKPVRPGFGFPGLRALEARSDFTPPFDEVKGKLLADARRELETSLAERLSHDVTVKRFPEHLASKETSK